MEAWTGLTDVEVEGVFPRSYGGAWWARGQPDDGGGGPSEDCVVLVRGPSDPRTMRWADVSCGELRGFICQVSLP